jgi:hypothetical protein
VLFDDIHALDHNALLARQYPLHLAPHTLLIARDDLDYIASFDSKHLSYSLQHLGR